MTHADAHESISMAKMFATFCTMWSLPDLGSQCKWWCHLMMGKQATSVLLLVEETQTSVTVWSTVEWTR